MVILGIVFIGGFNPTFQYCALGLALVLFLFIFGCSLLIIFLGEAASHFSMPPGGLLWASLIQLGSCNLAKCPLVHSLPCPRIHPGSYVEKVPLDAKVGHA